MEYLPTLTPKVICKIIPISRSIFQHHGSVMGMLGHPCRTTLHSSRLHFGGPWWTHLLKNGHVIRSFTILPWSHSMTILEHIYISKNYPRNPKQCGGSKKVMYYNVVDDDLNVDTYAIHAYTIRRIPMSCLHCSIMFDPMKTQVPWVPSTRVPSGELT